MRVSSTMTKGTTRLGLTLMVLFMVVRGDRIGVGAVPGGGGQWHLLQTNVGIVAMHMQLLHNDRVVIFDRTDFGKSNLSLPNGKCRYDPTETVLKVDCTAHSIEYDVASNSFRPLFVQTDVWCSSGSAMPDGRLVQLGGYNDGERKVREFSPCGDGRSCDWQEIGNGLLVRRWYATSQLLPHGRQIMIGGTGQFNYEYFPKTPDAPNVYPLPFLMQTNDPVVENNLYPFVHLNVDGNLFIFANNRAVLFNYSRNTVVRNYPTLSNGEPRSYPSTGSSVLLPINTLGSGSGVLKAEVLVCGGAPKGARVQASKQNFLGALNTCGRIKITDPNPEWVVETMPLARLMGDMVLLPDGTVLIINGVSAGTAGWEYGRNPVLYPVLYRPDNRFGKRFQTMNPSQIPRVYHSAALLLRDGRVLVGGSNPHICYNFSGMIYPTELRLEAYSPAYLNSDLLSLRPRIFSPTSQARLRYGQRFVVQFSVEGTVVGSKVSVTIVAPSFTTHSFSMNQRLLVIGGTGDVTEVGKGSYGTEAAVPASGNLAPPGYYMLFVVHQGLPSEGIWIQIL